MEKKRKVDDNYNEKRKRMKKLEELCKRRRIILSSDEDETDDPVMMDDRTTSTTNGAASTPTPAPGPSVSTTADPLPATVDQELDDEILQLLGDPPKSDTTFGPDIHKDVATRWQEILSKGLPKDTKDQLLKEYAVPKNCELLVPPILNPEVKAAFSEILIKRDSALCEKQKQLGIALAALGKATQMLIEKEDTKKILKTVSDASRILCDSHHNESKTRRSFAMSAINPSMREVLSDTVRSKYLFGEIEEKLKTAKNVQRSGAELKPPVQIRKNPKFHINNFVKSLNNRATLRRNNRPDAGRRQFQTNRPAGAQARRATRGEWRRPAATTARNRSPPPPPPPRRSYRRT